MELLPLQRGLLRFAGLTVACPTTGTFSRLHARHELPPDGFDFAKALSAAAHCAAGPDEISGGRRGAGGERGVQRGETAAATNASQIR